jgi:SAM-dependent methyltransferase
MPDASVLDRMYDDSYCEHPEAAGEPASSLEKFSGVIEYAETLPPGLFIDYGCGDGKLLNEMRSKGWDVLGIDFNPEFASALKSQGIRVLGPGDPIGEKGDVVHLGDVLEHLTDMDAQVPKILDLVKDGGHIIAHGPLEANPNLFFRVVRAAKRFRKGRRTEMPPYHVTLATTRGQRSLFKRFGLEKLQFRVTEIAFPAVETLSLGNMGNPRTVGLFGLRKVSQLISRLDIENLGNRYFYVGRKTASQQSPS